MWFNSNFSRIKLLREGIRNLILGYPIVHNKMLEPFFDEIFGVNLEILGGPRKPGRLTTSIAIYKHL